MAQWKSVMVFEFIIGLYCRVSVLKTKVSDVAFLVHRASVDTV